MAKIANQTGLREAPSYFIQDNDVYQLNPFGGADEKVGYVKDGKAYRIIPGSAQDKPLDERVFLDNDLLRQLVTTTKGGFPVTYKCCAPRNHPPEGGLVYKDVVGGR
jgi:hypothetical protein